MLAVAYKGLVDKDQVAKERDTQPEVPIFAVGELGVEAAGDHDSGFAPDGKTWRHNIAQEGEDGKGGGLVDGPFFETSLALTVENKAPPAALPLLQFSQSNELPLLVDVAACAMGAHCLRASFDGIEEDFKGIRLPDIVGVEKNDVWKLGIRFFNAPVARVRGAGLFLPDQADTRIMIGLDKGDGLVC